MEYYLTRFKLDSLDYFCIWSNTDNPKKSFQLSDKGGIVCFTSIEMIDVYANNKGIQLKGEDDLFDFDFDFDYIQNFINKIECNLKYRELLCAWNFFQDVVAATSVKKTCKFTSLDEENDYLYNELIYASNVLSEPQDKPYSPNLSEDDINDLIEVLEAGLNSFRSNLSIDINS